MPHQPSPAKATLRRAALARRQALGPAEIAERSLALSQQLFAHFPVSSWHWLHVFLPLASKNEADTWPVIHRIWAEKLALQLAAPVVQANGTALKNYELTPTTLLRTSRWGIPEPEPDAATEVVSGQLDAVLVPLLYCDQRGHRVGYGGGFYDRFLAQCRPGTAFIGLNVLNEPPGPAIADVLPTDVPLTAYITPAGVWNFT